jgi:transposase-like protein
MPTTRENHPPILKAKVAVEVIKGHKTTTQIAQTFGVHLTQVGRKKHALAGLPEASATATSASCSTWKPRRTSSTNRSAN